jgi:RNA recognition motif-containing protein
MNIYCGNLNWQTTEADLQAAFEAYGEVSSVTIIKDRYTGQSRGFGFVEMANDSEGKAAIDGLNGKELDGRTLRVDEARPRDDNRSRDNRRY